MHKKIIPLSIMESLVGPKFDQKSNINISSYDKKILVSAQRKNEGLYIINTKKNSFKKRHKGNFVGCTKCERGYIALKIPNKLCLFDFELNKISESEINNGNEDIGLHGVALSGDGYIYIVETRKNKVVIFNEKTFKKEAELILSNGKADLHHINDIFLTEDSLFVSMFSVLGKWKNAKMEDWDGAIIRFDRRTLEPLEVVVDNLTAPHSIKIYKDYLYYCESLKLNVSRINLKTKEKEVLAQFNGFTRGLDIDSNLLIVGQSKMRHLQRLNKGFTNISIDAGIHLYDEKNNVSRFICLPVENVYSILVI